MLYCLRNYCHIDKLVISIIIITNSWNIFILRRIIYSVDVAESCMVCICNMYEFYEGKGTYYINMKVHSSGYFLSYSFRLQVKIFANHTIKK